MARAVIFDIDGTLIDSVDLHAKAWQEAFRRFGKEIPYEAVRHQIGKGGDQLIPVFLSTAELDRFGKQLDEWRGERYREAYLPLAKPFPKVRQLFERLRRDGMRIALASSSKSQELEHYQRLAGIADLVDGATAKDDVGHSKPCPDIFAAALERLAPASAAETLVVGDTPYDAEAAGKLGLATIGVRCGGFPEAELKEAGCIALYDDPADLLARYDETPFSPRGLARAAE